MCLIGCGIAAFAKSTAVLIIMRVVQASGVRPPHTAHTPALTLPDTTGGRRLRHRRRHPRRKSPLPLSHPAPTPRQDIYEPSERGTMVGIYYAAPLLGPAIGPLIGGVVTQLVSWRATFLFLVIFAGLSLLSFVCFRDTFRRQRSLAYQSALRGATRERDERLRAKEKALRLEEGDDRSVDITAVDLEGRPELAVPPTLADVRLSLLDINPLRPIGSVLSRRNNLAVLFPSGEQRVRVRAPGPADARAQRASRGCRTASRTRRCARSRRRRTCTTRSRSGSCCCSSAPVRRGSVCAG